MNAELKQKLPVLPEPFYWTVDRSEYAPSGLIICIRKLSDSSLSSTVFSEKEVYTATVGYILDAADELMREFKESMKLEEFIGVYPTHLREEK